MNCKEFCKGLSVMLRDSMPDLFPENAWRLVQETLMGPFLLADFELTVSYRDEPLHFQSLIPRVAENGVFSFRGKSYMIPYVLIEKKERMERDSPKNLDMQDFFVIPSFFLQKFLELQRLIVLDRYVFPQEGEKRKQKNTLVPKEPSLKKTDDEALSLKITRSLFSFPFSPQLRTVFRQIGQGNTHVLRKERTIKVLALHPFQEINPLHRLSESRKVLYHSEKVADSMRMPHPSHQGRLDMLETPESESIGLTLFMSKGAQYCPSTLSILPASCDDLQDSLSFSTACVPFIPHSDGARVSMGAKNLKQAVRVVGGELPRIRTGVEEEVGMDLGVNTRVVYQLMEGMNFEDGVVISESFARKMTARRRKTYTQDERIPWNAYEAFAQGLEDRSFFRFSWEQEIHGKRFPNGAIKSKVSYQIKKKPAFKGDILLRESLETAECTDPGSKGKGHSRQFSEVFRVEEQPTLISYQDRYPGNVVDHHLELISIQSEEMKDQIKGNIAHFRFHITVEQECPLEVGDKITGRHGNKGTVSRILPDAQMPQIEMNGSFIPSEVVISPMSVVSRMNMGQLVETHLGAVEEDVCVPAFSRVDLPWLLEALRKTGADDLGYHRVDGKPAVAGVQYFLRLNHFARDKLHVVAEARTSIHAQPSKGKRALGGQRIGEMEFWTLFSHGSLGIIQDFALTNLDAYKEDPRRHEIQNWVFSNSWIPDDPKGKRKKPIWFTLEPIEQDKGTSDSLVKTRTVWTEGWGLKPVPTETRAAKDYLCVNQMARHRRKTTKHTLLNGKDGFLRKHMLGRRIHFSGRTVITPHTDLLIDEVALPVDFGLEWFLFGQKKLPLPKESIEKALSGDPIERQKLAELFTDWARREQWMVLLNRQPSLHRHSIQAFEPVFWRHYTIGLPILVCEGLGADFDGDTIAAYLPCSILRNKKDKQEILKEMDAMRPSRNPYRLGDRKPAWSLSQDLVYGRYLEWVETSEPDDPTNIKKLLLEEVKTALAQENTAGQILEMQKRLLTRCRQEPISLSLFDASIPQGNGRNMHHFIRSQARGKEKQFKQLFAQIEFDNLETENRVLNGINFTQGVPAKAYFFQDTHPGVASSSRKGLMDKKLKVATAGYLTRKLVEFLYPFRIGAEDCGSDRLLELTDETVKDIHLDQLLLGRFYKQERDGEIFVASPKEISMLQELLKEQSLWVRSPTCCALLDKKMICRKCYGMDPSRAWKDRVPLVSQGDFVGVSAGHVIGECSTQLAMKVFQTGQEFSVDDLSRALFSMWKSNAFYPDILKLFADYPQIRDNIDVLMIHYEILYAWLSIHRIENESSMKKMMSDPQKVGLFTALSFEGTDRLLKQIRDSRSAESHDHCERSPKAVLALIPEKVKEVLKCPKE